MSKKISKNSKDKSDQFIKKMVELFYNPKENDYQKEIEKAKNAQSTSNSLVSFLKEHCNSKFDEDAFYDMITKIINTKIEFKTLMDIYLITNDKIRVEKLALCFKRRKRSGVGKS